MNSQLSLWGATPELDASVRRTQHEGTTYFSLVDIMAHFVGDPETTWGRGEKAGQKKKLLSDPRVIWQYTKKRLQADGFDVYSKIIQLKLKATDGKQRLTDCADGQTCLRIVQSIPSPKAEPIRQWLAQLGYERLEEAANPELGINRANQRFLTSKMQQGYTAQEAQEFLLVATQGRVTRNELTDVLRAAVVDAVNYGQATNAEYRGMFGRTAKELRQITGFKNARDGMTVEGRALLTAAESTMRRLIGDRDHLQFVEAMGIIEAVAGMYRLSVERVQEALGIDLATSLPMLRG